MAFEYLNNDDLKNLIVVSCFNICCLKTEGMQLNAKGLSGFTIGATDGEIGKVEAFYFEDETWTIRYLVVKTGGWLSERRVLLSLLAIRHSPEDDYSMPLKDVYKEKLHHYYGKSSKNY